MSLSSFRYLVSKDKVLPFLLARVDLRLCHRDAHRRLLHFRMPAVTMDSQPIDNLPVTQAYPNGS